MGNVLTQGSSTVTSRGVCINSEPNPSIENTCVSSGSGLGSFNVKLSDLKSNTTYHVRAFATNSIGTTYGVNIEFTTKPEPRKPFVITTEPNEIKVTSARLGGDVQDEGTSMVTERGVCYSSSKQEPTFNDTCLSEFVSGVGGYSLLANNLTQNTTYYVRSFAVNDVGFSFGDPLSFKTEQFTNPVPNLVSIEPNATSVNSTVDVTIRGENFISGISLQVGEGIQVNNINLQSSSLLTAKLTTTASTPVGNRTITVTNPSPGGGVSTNGLNFSVTLPPPNPNSTNWPTGTVVPTSTQPTLEWTPVSGATNYTIQISNQSGFPQKESCSNCGESTQNSLTTSYTVTTTNFKVPTPLNIGTTYYWRLRANTSNVQGVWSNPFSFIIVSPPGKPVLLAPANGSTGLTGSVRLKWTPTSNTKKYEIQVSGDVTFTKHIVTTDTVTVPSFRMPSFTAGSPIDYIWRVRSKGDGGMSEWTTVWFYSRAALTNDDSHRTDVPNKYHLEQNFPNPFNPTTNISFSLPSTVPVRLEILSILGQPVSILVNQSMSSGNHTITFDASALSSGVYLYRLTTPEFTQTRVMSLVK